jgi:predicted ATPase
VSWGTHDADSEAARLETIVLLLASLASVRVNDARLAAIPPHERQQGTFDSLRAFLVGESHRQPVVVAIDDLQWVDETSEALLQQLVSSIPAHRLLVIGCARPEYDAPWVRRPGVVPIALQALETTERGRLMTGRLDGLTLPPDALALVADRSDGNPFFLEELLETLLERSADTGVAGTRNHVREGEPYLVPGRVEDVITARIDRLEEATKRVLQIAAVIGRQFDFDLLRDVAGPRDDLRQQLTRLVELELVREVAIFPSWSFAFRSSLAHEVTYGALLSGRRRELHAAVARAIERRAGERPEEFYELIAYHLSRSAHSEDAARSLIRAGEKAIRHFALTDARRYLDEAGDKVRRLAESAAMDLATDLGRARERLAAIEVSAPPAEL